jgi:hypothetical protein
MAQFPIGPKGIRHKVKSSMFDEVAFENFTLYVHFKTNDSIYSYNPVSEKRYLELVDAPSASAYFNKHFKTKSKLKINKI